MANGGVGTAEEEEVPRSWMPTEEGPPDAAERANGEKVTREGGWGGGAEWIHGNGSAIQVRRLVWRVENEVTSRYLRSLSCFETKIDYSFSFSYCNVEI